MKNLKRFLSIFLILALLFTLFPAAVYAEEGEEPGEKEIPELEELSDASDILAQDMIVPEGLETAVSVYNEGVNKPFALIEKDEIFLYGCYKDGSTTASPMPLIDTVNLTDWTESGGYGTIPGFTASSVKSHKQISNGFHMEMNFQQGVAFDPTGCGKSRQ